MSHLKIWWEAVRAFSFTASVIPVLLGTALAYQDGFFNFQMFVLALVGAVLIQAGTNLTNDYYDYKSGVDRLDDLGVQQAGPSMVIQRGLLSERTVLGSGVLCLLIGAVIGFYLVSKSGLGLLVPGLLSVAAAYFYTARPVALAYLALGELTVFFFMGPMIVLGAYYVQTATVSWEAFLMSLPVALLVTSILHANNLRDIHRDRERGKRTVANLTGERFAAIELALLVLLPFAIVAWSIGAGLYPLATVAVFATLPDAVKVARVGFEGVSGPQTNRNVLNCAELHGKFGILLVAAVILATHLPRLMG